MTISTFTRRSAALCLAAMLAPLAHPVAAQPFPSKPIRIIVGFAPGGTADAVARLYGQKLGELLNTPVNIDNKPGGNQVTAIRALMASPADGYTLYAASGSSLVQNPALRKDLPYDPLKDFTLLGVAVTNPGVLFVNKDLPIRNLAELVSYAAAHPGKLNYGSGGVGSAGHLAGEVLFTATGMKLNHIPYKNDIEVVRETMAGNVHVAIFPTLNTIAHVKAGTVRAIGVTTPRRLPYLPGVPSLAEAKVNGLSDLEPHTFIALVGPAGLPPAIVSQLNDAINKVSALPEVATRVRESLYAEPAALTPTEFRTFVDKELVKWRAIGKTIKLTE